MEKNKCENCGKEHDGSYGSGRFCCQHCRRQWSGKRNTNPANNLPYKTKEGGWECPYCGEVFRVRAELNEHKRENHPYVDENGKRKSWNKGQTAKTNESIARSVKTLKQNIKEGKIVRRGRKLSEEAKKNISEGRKKYLLEHPEKAPYRLCHRHIKGESYPERYFRKILSKYKVDFKQEVQCGLYSLDFLVGNVDIEIDGHQHYSDERIIESDKRRTKFLEENGFVVKRIRWSWYSKLSTEERKNFIFELIQFLNNTKKCPFPLLNNKVKVLKKKFKQVRRNIPPKEDLIKKIEEIGFNKVQLGNFYGVSDNAVNRWLVKYGIPKSRKDFKIWIEQR